MAEPRTPPKERPHPSSAPNPPHHLLDGAQPRYHSYQAGATPRSFKTSATEEFTTPSDDNRDRRYKALARESRGHFVGPVDPAWFIKHHLNIQETLNSQTHTFPPFPDIVPDWTKLREPMRESEMYQLIVDGARPFLNEHAKDKSGFVDSHNAKDPIRDDLSPDIINYSRWITAPRSKVDLSKCEYVMEVKTGVSLDPFVDNDDESSHHDHDYPFEATAELRTIARGQILQYCYAIARVQFRTHLFGVIILGRRARLFRWDPAAMVVTSLFDYTTKTNNYLAQFIWFYDNASPRTRGHDISVQRISRRKANELVGHDITADVESRNADHSHFCTMNISDRENGDIQHPHLISFPPSYKRGSPFGRMTRTMHAFDTETKQFVFVKDYWRVAATGMEKEGDIYSRLEQHNVPNIAPFGNGNDVQCEVWSKQTKKPVLKPVHTRYEVRPEEKVKKHRRLEKWTLYRMSLKVIGDGLQQFQSTKQLVTAIADAMEAHDCAFFDARVLHRDISVGNILIHNGGGLLIDWDLCSIVDGEVKGPRRPQRTGTWQFMSAAILQDPTKVHDICDDRESAFHVLTWTALCYGKHDKKQPHQLRKYLKHYDYFYSAGTYTEGGELKRDALLQSVLAKQVLFNPALDRLIKDLTDHLRVRYFDIGPSDHKSLEHTTKMITNLEQKLGDTETTDDLEMLRQFRSSHPAYQFTTNMERLKRRNWLVETMRRHLAQPDWPLEKDTALQEGRHLVSNSKKRPLEDDPYMESASKSKVARRAAYLDVSSSRVPFTSDSSGLGAVMEEDEPAG